ncbi:peptidase S11 [Ramlibacter sp. USB13]|uniref:Peptidase S11 n=1 Tax=Ramlibacter cellulosilyticus TaxID=2764187 RepID=A0A923MR73_9BURK|nr:peptidase S11 [Ramlibacter cellulosilyticus]
MSPQRKRNFRVAALLAALVAAGALLPLAYRNHVAVAPAPSTQVATAPAPAAPPAPAEGEETAPPPAPPGAEVVPPEESESDRGPAAASPAGPTLSYGRAAGLHLTPDPLKLNSSAALLVDQDSGEVLMRKNDQVVLPMASLTKLMTTLLVLEAKQPMDEVLTITEEDVDKERHSRSRLRVGTQLTREEALHLALMSSENRAAHALGRAYPGGLPRLVEAMNAKAKQLGMKDTTYVDPTGLSNRNQSTARDLAVLVRTASQNPTMREFSTTPSHVATLGSRTLQYINSNRLVRNQRAGWDIELQKTGYIVEAGRCLTMLTDVGGRNLIMVLLDSDSNGARLGDAERMRRWVVAKLGLPDTVARAREDAAPRKVAASKKKAAESDRKVAKKSASKKTAGKTAVAKGKDDGKRKAVARTKAEKDSDTKQAKKEGGRVKQTFAAARDGDKS